MQNIIFISCRPRCNLHPNRYRLKMVTLIYMRQIFTICLPTSNWAGRTEFLRAPLLLDPKENESCMFIRISFLELRLLKYMSEWRIERTLVYLRGVDTVRIYCSGNVSADQGKKNMTATFCKEYVNRQPSD